MNGGGNSIVRPRIVLFRAYEKTDWLYSEMLKGRLRQGWGASGLSFLTPNGQKVSREAWNREYKNVETRKKSRREKWDKFWAQRYATLSNMLKMTDGDVVVVPKMPSPRQFTIACVSGVYCFDVDTGWGDGFGHIIPISPQSVATFNYDSNKDTKEVSDYFGHGGAALAAISYCRSQRVIKSCLNLLHQSSP